MPKHKIKYLDCAKTDYGKTWEIQQEIFNRQLSLKKEKQATENHLLFVEHPHVYTLGRSGSYNNLLISNDMMKSINATYYKVDRGGDITYHGPGQIVGYPIFDLEALQLTYKGYIDTLETSIIRFLKIEHNIESRQLEGATGVWIDTDNGPEKICAIGTKASRYITMHGFALNVNTDLKYFGYINPCGFTDKGVTSLQKIKGCILDFENEKILLRKHIAECFNAELIL